MPLLDHRRLAVIRALSGTPYAHDLLDTVAHWQARAEAAEKRVTELRRDVVRLEAEAAVDRQRIADLTIEIVNLRPLANCTLERIMNKVKEVTP